jgi:hypothetical protein
MQVSDFGDSIGRRGLGAPGEADIDHEAARLPFIPRGTSIAAAFVTGAVGLLLSLRPAASSMEVKQALGLGASPGRRSSVVPPLMDAGRALERLRPATNGGLG